MSSGYGLVGPSSYPIRNPKSAAMRNGRIVNGPRYMKLGGFSGPGKWPNGNEFRVESPTNVGKVSRDAERRGGGD